MKIEQSMLPSPSELFGVGGDLWQSAAIGGLAALCRPSLTASESNCSVWRRSAVKCGGTAVRRTSSQITAKKCQMLQNSVTSDCNCIFCQIINLCDVKRKKAHECLN